MADQLGEGGEFLMADMDGASFNEIDKVEEMKSLQRVLDAYTNYRGSFEDDVMRWERSYHRLTPVHQALVPELPAKYAALRKCADQNALLIDTMLQAFRAPFEPEDTEGLGEEGIDLGAGGLSDHAVRLGATPESLVEATTSDDVNHSQHENKVPQPNPNNNEWESNERRIKHLPLGEDSSLIGQKRSMPEAGTSGRDVQGASALKGAINGFPEQDSGVEPFRTHAEGTGPVHTHADGSRPVHTHTNGLSLARGAGEHSHWRVPPSDVEKVRCVLRNVVRDWTSEGAKERSKCYAPILAELQSCFPNRESERPPSCVVPGAGLARLACEISRLGFECQGNEFSYYTLIVSSFILNMTDGPDEWTFFPWIHSQCNTQRDADMLRPLRLPDLHPGSAGISEGFSMCAGDFLEVYGGRNQAGAWDSVVTCFFIDTAHNVIAHLEVIARILKPGGVWINFGPLLYHFADAHQYSQDDELSVELSLETILRIASSFGLTLKHEPQVVSTSYTGNPRSMMTTRYQCAFWTMVKER